MNKVEFDILNKLHHQKYSTQRDLAAQTGYSLGTVNRISKDLQQEGYLNSEYALTQKAKDLLSKKHPHNAVILAAGYGMRMVPINMETPKGLLEINGETLIERLIRQLQEVHIAKIYIVVGFLKEKYEYLIDQYGVELIVNEEYSQKNNLHSLALAAAYLGNSYVIPCDIWCRQNPFSSHESYTWYMVSEAKTMESSIKVTRKMQLSKIGTRESGNKMIGISYIDEEQIEIFKENLIRLDNDARYNHVFWEEALLTYPSIPVWAKIVKDGETIEINTYEQLRELDSNSNQLKTEAIRLIGEALKVPYHKIKNISVLKKGMTNRSFLFECEGRKYIMRVPGEGTDRLINRSHEYKVYQALGGKEISDRVIYLNPVNGYKITEFVPGAKCCDPYCPEDVAKCMDKLRTLHGMKLKVSHRFDLFEKIDLYESFWNGEQSVYRDYEETKKNILSLKPFLENCHAEECLTHIDAVPDNFLLTREPDGSEQVFLIDWEYAGMQDPHVDLAMFSIYSFYNKAHIDRLIDTYFREACAKAVRIKIYCYVAICGLLWSNWCEYKRNLGVEFGEYSLRQYRYAKEYYRIASEAMEDDLL